MNSKRFLDILIGVTLLAALLLTVREAAATSDIAFRVDSASAAECSSMPSRHSIRTEYDSDRSAWVTYSEDGPTGVDGGLPHILSACSR